MIYDEEKSEWEFESSGRRVYAHTDLLSVGEDGRIFYGYDGGLDRDDLNRAERLEIATLLLDRAVSFLKAARTL